MRLCDVYSIPLSTNMGIAELFLHALERGDLGWREIINNDDNSR